MRPCLLLQLFRNTGRVCEGEVALGDEGLGGRDLDFSRHRLAVVFESGFPQVVEHVKFYRSAAPGAGDLTEHNHITKNVVT